MKRLMLVVAVILWFGAEAARAGGPSPAAERDITKPGVVVTDVLEVKATVEAIDHKKQVFTLKGSQGRTLTLKADKAVRNFDQLKKGDVVLADFVESIAIFLRAAKGPPGAAEARLVSVAPKGANRGVLLAETFQVAGVVDAIDYKSRQVTLKEPNGSIRIFSVDSGFKNLDRFKKGEALVARVTEAIAIRVEKRK